MYEVSDFIEQYKVLEKWAYTKYDDGVNGLEQYHPDKRIQSDLTYFRKIRNVLSHNPNGTTKPLIELTDEFRERFEAVCHKLMNSVSEISIPYKNIFKREMSDKVIPTISVMKERSFSHVPVMNGKKMPQGQVSVIFTNITRANYLMQIAEFLKLNKKRG